MNRLAFLLGLLLAAAAPLHAAVDEDDLLPIEEAFAVQASVGDDGQLRLDWRIAEGYYLYRHRLGLASGTGGVSVGDMVLPAGTAYTDEFFGDVETYRRQLLATAPLTWPPGLASADLDVRFQGCADVGVCYPPHRYPVKVDLPAGVGRPALAANGATGQGTGDNPLAAGTSPGAVALPGAGGDNPLAQLLGGGNQPVPMQDDIPAQREPPLPEEQAFVFETIALSPTELLARFTMPGNYYLYRDNTRFSIQPPGLRMAAPAWPAATPHVDDHFGEVAVFFGQIELPITVAPSAAGNATSAALSVEFQGCQLDGICYPPMTRQIRFELPAASQEQFAQATAFVDANPYMPSALKEPLVNVPATLGIFGALVLALLGGVILNLMPCVLPVLSLKVLGVAQSGESVAKARSHALWYTLGVLVSFAAVGLAVVALRAAGQALGWGFQLQQPLFVAVLVYVMAAVGLSLSGVFNVGTGLIGVGQGLTSRSGPTGDFFTGVLAVVVASPCTIPLMSPALTYAFSSSALMALLIFLMLGLGLALPFLLIGFVPALASRLPRPGAWMETLKQFLAFPMYLTAIWLLWVLGRQRGVDAVALALAGVTVLALGLWWWERNRYRSSSVPRVVAIALMALSLLPLAQIPRLDPPARAGMVDVDANHVAFSAERLASLRAEGRGVFVDMTADWCITCKANERAVINTDRFRDLLERSNTTLMIGDWTNVDPLINDFLRQYNSPGVPLYVVFRPGEAGPGQVLPTVLTHGIVEQALAP